MTAPSPQTHPAERETPAGEAISRETSFGDEYVFTFGKFKGHSIQYVLIHNASYIIWCEDNIDWFRLKDDIRSRAEDISAQQRECRAIKLSYIRSFGRYNSYNDWGGLTDDDFR